MEQDFRRWLRQQHCCWYLLTREQEENYFHKWLNEIENNRKEKEEHGKMV